MTFFKLSFNKWYVSWANPHYSSYRRCNNLKPTLSAGHDNISAKLLKETIHIFKLSITYIINKSFSVGIFPEKLQIAKLVPIYKTWNKDELNNYKSISLLPAFSKVIENLI